MNRRNLYRQEGIPRINWYFKNILIAILNRTLSGLVSLGRIAKPVISVTLVRPIHGIGRFLFNHVLVNLYRVYFAIKPKSDPMMNTSSRGFVWTFINNRQAMHAGVFVVAVMTMFINITETQAENYVEGTLLNKLITKEFPTEELIVENADIGTKSPSANIPIKYTSKGYVTTQPKSQGELTEAELLSDIQVALSSNGSAITKQEVATTGIDKGRRDDAIVYIVEPGDTVTSIAQKFDISINTILWENNLSAYSIIRPGKELSILPVTGINHIVKKGDSIAKIAENYQVEPDEILNENNILNESDIQIGQVVFVPEGLKPKPAPRTIVRTAPTTQQTFDDAPVGGDLIWPTNGYRITQYYTWRHFGLDVGNKNGQPIYAAADGKVIISSQGKWNGGYGNQIVVDHGNGIETRYAHTSYNIVSVGETVKQGQVIAAIGSTGRSSGPHIHFEIEINGRRVNPLNYLSR